MPAQAPTTDLFSRIAATLIAAGRDEEWDAICDKIELALMDVRRHDVAVAFVRLREAMQAESAAVVQEELAAAVKRAAAIDRHPEAR